ncbi:MAG: hypothetical protein LBI02_12380, partial [Opitutaceae bacterium]|nr:hypothetical protein [Opitutaceae bacterium]
MKTQPVTPRAARLTLARRLLLNAAPWCAALGLLLPAPNAPAETHEIEAGGTITTTLFNSWNDGDTIMLKGDVQLGASPLTFDGKTFVFKSDTPLATRVIDALGTYHFATIYAGGTLTLDDIEIKNSIRGNNSGAILINGGDASGTAMFKGNFAITNATSGAAGGAIYVNQGSLHLGGNVTFTGNTAGATNAAGAIHVNTAGATLTFAGVSTFTSNTAGTTGGAINMGNNGTLLFKNTATFTGNMTGAVNAGGAINVGSGASITFEGVSTFTSNISGSGGGGGINIGASGSLVFKDNATFTGNLSNNGGAAIITSSPVIFEKDALFYSNTQASTASNRGGAIHIAGAGSLLIQGNAVFENNHN